jgi:hypothetical protein
MLLRAQLASVSLLAFLFAGAVACGSHGSATGSSTSGGGSSTMSTQCQAYCAKVMAAGCGTTCDPEMVCQPQVGECNASADARIACEVETGTFTCAGGNLDVQAPNCVPNDALCADGGDGG